jgi:hypothetical protein
MLVYGRAIFLPKGFVSPFLGHSSAARFPTKEDDFAALFLIPASFALPSSHDFFSY